MFIFIIIFILSSYSPYMLAYAATSSVYAQVLYSNVYLYRTDNGSSEYDNIWFLLEKDYYVVLYSSSGDYYYCEYNNIYGYVLKSCVQCVSGTPTTAYVAEDSIRIYAEASRSLRSVPTSISGEITLIQYLPLYTTNVTYIASTIGEELIPDRSSIWYYVKYTSDEIYYGYIYSEMCDGLDDIAAITTRLTYIDPPSFLLDNISSYTTNSNTSLVIAILSIPAIIFTISLLRSQSILSKPEKKATRAPKGEITLF